MVREPACDRLRVPRTIPGHGNPHDQPHRRRRRLCPPIRRPRAPGAGGAARAHGAAAREQHADRPRPGRLHGAAGQADRRDAGSSRSAPSPATARRPWRSPCRRTDGSLCCDVSREWTDIARQAWADAGVADRIELRLGAGHRDAGDARGRQLRPRFIDADKPNYDAYYEGCLRVVRPGGLILIDNVLWSGDVADPADRRRQRAGHPGAEREDRRR